MAVPPPPPGLSRSEFGERLWGTGPDDAKQRLSRITRRDLEQLGLTCDLVVLWREFYREQVERDRGMPTSQLRIELLERCLELLT